MEFRRARGGHRRVARRRRIVKLGYLPVAGRAPGELDRAAFVDAIAAHGVDEAPLAHSAGHHGPLRFQAHAAQAVRDQVIHVASLLSVAILALLVAEHKPPRIPLSASIPRFKSVTGASPGLPFCLPFPPKPIPLKRPTKRIRNAA